MKKTIQVNIQQEAISLITDITYKMEAYWYGETERPLKMSILLPKHKENHTTPLPLIVWFCGGAFQVVDKDIWIPQLVPLAKQGFIIASVEYRTINDAPLPASLIDARAAIRYLKAHAKQYLIDTDNIRRSSPGKHDGSIGRIYRIRPGRLSGTGHSIKRSY